MISDHPLTPWEKLSIIFLGGGVVSFTLLLVVCFVCPTCLIFKTFNRGKVTIFGAKTQCLKITQNVAFEFLNFGIFHQFLSY